MFLYLMRHGIAVDRLDPRCPPDPERPLTDRGAARTRRAAAGLRASGVAPEVVLTSPYVRARQTAEIAAEELGVPAKRIVEVDALVPDGEPDELWAVLRQSGRESVLCVGHAPQLDVFLADALCSREVVVTKLKKAGVACLELTRGPHREGCRLASLLPPRALRDLADGGAPRTDP